VPDETAAQWGDLVRRYFPGYTGHHPRVQHWHGTADLVSLITAQVDATRHEVDLVLETEAGRARYLEGLARFLELCRGFGDAL
jgi:hypothetical protein